MDQYDLNHKIFCFKDVKSVTYGPPITAQTRGMFFRDIMDELKKGQAIWARHPMDFSIYELGEYDSRLGEIRLYPEKNCLGLVQDLAVNSSN